MLQSIIIASEAGLPLYARSLMCNIGFKCIDLRNDKKLQEDSFLKSALFSAKIMYDDIQQDSFHEFELEKTKVLTFTTERVFAMFTLVPKSDTSNFKNRLKLIGELFCENFSLEIDNFVGNAKAFESFDEIITEKGLLEEGERFRANCMNCIYDKACPYRVFTGPLDETLGTKIEKIEYMSFVEKFFQIIKGLFFTKWFLTPKIK